MPEGGVGAEGVEGDFEIGQVGLRRDDHGAAVANAWPHVVQKENEETNCKRAAPDVDRVFAPKTREREQQRAGTPEQKAPDSEALGQFRKFAKHQEREPKKEPGEGDDAVPFSGGEVFHSVGRIAGASGIEQRRNEGTKSEEESCERSRRYSNELAGFQRRNRVEDLSHEGSRVHQADAFGLEHDHGDREGGQILLER